MSSVIVPDDGGDTLAYHDIGGILTPAFACPKLAAELFKRLPEFPVKDDDLMLCTFIKTGTNWAFELMTMMLKKSAERDNNSSKLTTMIDILPPEEMAHMPSPRILNSHFSPKYLPKQLKTKQTKTVLCLRNPKDTCVSAFHHMKGFKVYSYDGKIENFISPWAAGKLEYGAYSAYLNEWQQSIEAGIGFPLHIMYYEDLKLDCRKEIDRLAEFLDIDIDDDLKNQIMEECHFDKMAKEKISITESFLGVALPFVAKAIPADDKEKMAEMTKLAMLKPKELASTMFLRDNYSFYRKGMVGDWKNHFSVAKSEIFDEIWNRDIRKDTMFNFKYSSA